MKNGILQIMKALEDQFFALLFLPVKRKKSHSYLSTIAIYGLSRFVWNTVKYCLHGWPRYTCYNSWKQHCVQVLATFVRKTQRHFGVQAPPLWNGLAMYENAHRKITGCPLQCCSTSLLTLQRLLENVKLHNTVYKIILLICDILFCLYALLLF